VAKAKAKVAETPAKPAATRQPTAITVRGSKEWRAWVESGAKHCLTDTSKLVDMAVTTYLRDQGFKEPRPER
jgi:hypothetical protein